MGALSVDRHLPPEIRFPAGESRAVGLPTCGRRPMSGQRTDGHPIRGVFRAASLPRQRCDYLARIRSFPGADWAVHPWQGRRRLRRGRRGSGNGVEPASRHEGTKRELQPDEKVQAHESEFTSIDDWFDCDRDGVALGIPQRAGRGTPVLGHPRQLVEAVPSTLRPNRR